MFAEQKMGISTRFLGKRLTTSLSTILLLGLGAMLSPQSKANFSTSPAEVSGHQANLRLYNLGSSCNELIRRASQRKRYGRPTVPSNKQSEIPILAGGDVPRPSLMKEARKRQSLALEVESGGTLASAGYQTEHLPEIVGGNGHGSYLRDDGVRIPYKSNPDLLVEGRAFDVYSPEDLGGVRIKAIAQKVRKQSRRIVINLSRAGNLDTKATITEIRNNSRRPKGQLKGLEEAFIIKDGKIIEHLVRSKEGFQLVPYERPKRRH